MIRSSLPMKIAKIGYIIASLILCIFGLFIVIKPQYIPINTIRFGGLICILFGVIKLVGYFSKDLYRLAFQFDFELGLLYIILGLIFVLNLGKAVNYLAVVVGLFVMIDGLFKLRIAKDAKVFGLNNWWIILVVGLLTSILGGCLAFTIGKNSLFCNVLLGLVLLSEGILNLLTALITVKIIKHQKEDVIDVDYRKR